MLEICARGYKGITHPGLLPSDLFLRFSIGLKASTLVGCIKFPLYLLNSDCKADTALRREVLRQTGYQ